MQATEGATWAVHFDRHPEQGGVPSQQRFLGSHAECLCPAFRMRSEAKPVAYLMMGAPGAGKSQLVGAWNFDIVLRIDPDVFKLALPEFESLGAPAVHEESSWMAAQARAVAIGRSCTFVNDAVGSSAGKYAALIRKLRANGYTTQLVCVHILDIDELIRRVAYRAERTGRIVPEQVVRDAHEKVPSVFNRLRDVVDDAFLWDGITRNLVWSRNHEGKDVRDGAFLRRLGKAGDDLINR